MIKITYVPNKFENIKVEGELPFDIETPWLLCYIADFADTYKEHRLAICQERITVYVNGIEIVVNDWNEYKINDEDTIQIVPTIEGGNGGFLNIILGVILIVVAVALAPYTGGGTVAALAGEGAAFMIGLAGAIMVLGGIVGLLFGASTPDMPVFGSGANSPTYSWEGIQLTATTDRPIGVCYGEHIIGGNVINAFVDSTGTSNYLNLLIGLCEGEIEGIMKADGSGVCTSVSDFPDINVNGQPLRNYSTDIQWDYRLGTNNQLTIPRFNNTHTYYNDGRKITTTGIIYTTSTTACNEIELRVASPSLFQMDGGGGIASNFIDYKIEIRPHGTSTWAYATGSGYIPNPVWLVWEEEFNAAYQVYLVTYQEPISWGWGSMYYSGGYPSDSVETKASFRETYRTGFLWFYTSIGVVQGVAHPEPTPLIWTDTACSYQSLKLSGNSKSTTRENRIITNLSDGQYDVKITRTSPEQTDFRSGSSFNLEGVDEIMYHDLSYPNTALLSFRMLATEQLSGSIPNITTKIRGRKVRVPTLTCRGNTVLYNDCYWDPTTLSYISPVSYAGDNKCVINTSYSTWSLQWSQNPVWCLVDYLTVRRFGLGQYLSDVSIEWSYALTAAKYSDTMVDSLDGTGRLEKRFLCDGVWDSAQGGLDCIIEFSKLFRSWAVWTEGRLKLIVDKAENPIQLFNMSNIVTGSYSQTFASKTAKPNEFEVQYADKDNEYKFNTINVVDQDAWSAGDTPVKTSVALKGVTRGSQARREANFYIASAKYRTQVVTFKGTLNSIHCQAGDTISFQHDVPRWASGGRVVVASLYSNTITLDSDVTVTSTPCKIYFQSPLDVFTTATVTNTASTWRSLTVTPALTSTTLPTEGCVWSFGESGAEKKDFKILAINKDKENDAVIAALEYNESVYSDTGDSFSLVDPSSLPNPMEPPDAVTDFRLTELFARVAFVVSFNIPRADSRFSYAKVFLSTNGETFYEYATSTTAEDIEISGVAGQTYYVEVATYNKVNVSSLSNKRRSYITLRVVDYPVDVTGLEISGLQVNSTTFEGRDCKVQWKRTESFELSTSSSISDYRVDTVVNNVVVRSEYTTDNWYTYTYEHNKDDNTTPVSTFTISVWARNRSNSLSVNPSSITVSNDTPDPVTGLVVTSIIGGVSFLWEKSTETDLQCYYARTKISTGSYGSWSRITNNAYTRILDSGEVASYGSNCLVYMEVQVIDVFNQVSSSVIGSEYANSLSDNLFQLVGSKSGGTGILSELYNGIRNSGGITIA